MPTTREADGYPVVERDDSTLRAYKDDVLAHFGKPLIDVRSPEEYDGSRTSAPAYPEEGALRAGHIPTAQSVPWARAVAADGGFKPRAELDAIYRDEVGLADGDEIVAYCRIGERSSHTWFVLQHLLGFENVRNYDGSWTEWGSAVRVPDRHRRRAGRGPRLTDRPRAAGVCRPVGEWSVMTTYVLPDSLAEIRDEFLELPETDRLQLLLEFSNELPAVPARYDGHPELCERVIECQSPVYIVIDVDDDGLVAMHATAPQESPTTRGFASILVQGITGLTADEVLAIPDDFPQSIGLTRAVSPLRIAGMTGMLMRAKRQVAAKRAA